MPGVKSINWTEVNKAKVLDAVLFYHGNIKVENEVAAQIAQHMGENCTAKAVQTLLTGLAKRNFIKNNPGLAQTPTKPANGPVKSAPNSSTKKPAPANNNSSTKKATGARPRAKKTKAESGSRDVTPSRSNGVMSTPPETPIKKEPGLPAASETPKTPKTPTKSRSTPRSGAKRNYAAMAGAGESASEEDSDPSDAEFDGSKDINEEDDNGV